MVDSHFVCQVRYWDLGTEQEIGAWRGHTDYVRGGAAATNNTDVWFSGSYDQTVKAWDLRADGEQFNIIDDDTATHLIVCRSFTYV